MEIMKGTIQDDFNRDLYWTKVAFLSDDGEKKSVVFACASTEYLTSHCHVSTTQQLSEGHLNGWLDDVVVKWSKLGDAIFEKDVHFDVYATTQTGEANGIDYLLSKQSNE